METLKTNSAFLWQEGRERVKETAVFLRHEGPGILKAVFALLRDAGVKWGKDKASILAAGLAYYTIFSLAPITFIVLTSAAQLLKDSSVQEMIIAYVGSNFGPDTVTMIEGLLLAANENLSRSSGILATILGVVVLFWGASGVFNHLKNALNTIWGVELVPLTGLHGILYLLRTRLLASILVLGIGFLLSMTFLLNTLIATLDDYILQYSPKLFDLVNSVLTDFFFFLIPLILFALIFKALPDARVAWRDVWLGAFVTTLLFGVGNFALLLYFEYGGTGSAYGAAGSLIVLLFWINYSAQIFFYGAEFTKVYADRYGSKVLPSSGAVAIKREILPNGTPVSIEPVSLPVNFYKQEPYLPQSQNHQAVKQVAFGLFGMAFGLFLAFISKIRR